MIVERGDFEPNRTDNEFLIKFLRARFFNVENAYKLVCTLHCNLNEIFTLHLQQLIRYHAFRESNQDLYLNVDPLSLYHLGENDIVSVTPYKDQNGRRMMFYKIRNWKPSKIPINDLLKATLLLLEMGSLESSAQVNT